MSQQDAEQIKRAVRDRYARAAEGAKETAVAAEAAPSVAGCCGDASPAGDPGCCGDSYGTTLVDYGEADREVVAGANLGLGCGIPTALAGIRPGETVLDLGSGAGVDAFIAAGEVGADGRVIGVDMTPEMISLARENAAKGGHDNVEFRLGEIEHLPVAEETIDVVLSNCVINLVPDKSAAFAEVARVLKPGGRFCISDVVSYGTLPDEIRQSVEMYTGCVAGAMERGAYLDLIEAAGFEDIRVEEEKRIAPLDGEEYGVASVTLTGRLPG
jgi:SAM-dependent methyltransferase